MTTKINLNKITTESAAIYAECIVDACRKVRITDPLAALLDADDFPRLLKIPTVEFAIGWIHGVAESHEVTVEALWEQIAPEKHFSKAKGPAPSRRTA